MLPDDTPAAKAASLMLGKVPSIFPVRLYCLIFLDWAKAVEARPHLYSVKSIVGLPNPFCQKNPFALLYFPFMTSLMIYVCPACRFSILQRIIASDPVAL